MLVTRWWLLTMLGMVVSVVCLANTARADGGSYIELDKTYYLEGDAVVATTYVSIPRQHEGLLDAGPFYALALPGNVTLKPGALPAGSTRLGTFDVEEEKESYELTAHFTMPPLSPGVYTIAFCNDPCTVSGFREPLWGSFEVVQTAREIELLQQTGTLRGQVYRARRELNKADKQIVELQAHVEASEDAREELTSAVGDLRRRLDASEALVASESMRPIVHPAAAAGVCVTMLVLAVAVLRRPGRRPLRTIRSREPRVAG